MILKFIAWAERHRTAPGRDAYDLRMLLTHYLDAGNLRHLYEHHADLVDENFDYSLASARVAGEMHLDSCIAMVAIRKACANNCTTFSLRKRIQLGDSYSSGNPEREMPRDFGCRWKRSCVD